MSDHDVRTEAGEPPVTEALALEFGLKTDEYEKVLTILGRVPTLTELGIYSVMWSEHCSYKSSRKWLATLPTEAPWVIQGPGENAGVIDIGDGLTAIFKMESHNHPSFIEPFQGAATGVGGILRDVFTMGARPVALLNALSFGRPDHPRTRHLVSGVVAGIGGYGNCVGVPTVGGEVRFDSAYDGNILVNAMAVGIAPADRIFKAAASEVGAPVVYVGAKTGRDGIHGATMASAEFSADTEEKRPTVQVGDPFTEKLLIEACLELMSEDAILAIQDMGAAGLTSSSVEMADKGGSGIDLDLDAVPQREIGMVPYEIMLSESQERMLMVLRDGHEHRAREIFEKWGLDAVVVGRVTDTGRLVVRAKGQVVADLVVAPLVDQAPKYDRPWVPTPDQPLLDAGDVPLPAEPTEVLATLMGTPDLASKRWITEQYDSTVMADTAAGPGGDAGVIRVHGTNRALAVTSDCTPRYCRAAPETGGAQAVAEAWRNLTAVGAKPLAITDNLNFGNPEKPEIMGQLVGCLTGMGNACRALDFPVVSGNVSLYNETDGRAILPTPTIGAVGLLADVTRRADAAFKREGDVLVLIGAPGRHLGQSLYARDLHRREDGAPPPVDLGLERRTGDLVRGLIADDLVDSCHDVSDGGLLVAVAEMALAGDLGAELVVAPTDSDPAGFWFGEDQARYVVAVPDATAVIDRAAAAGIPASRIGRVAGGSLTVNGAGAISVARLREINEGWLPALMAVGSAQEQDM